MTSPVAGADLEAALLNEAAAVVEAGVARGALPSGILAVADRERILRLDARGPLGTDAIVLIASITKSIVSLAMLQLVERGLLLLNEPVVARIPEFGANGKHDVRLWHLLTHTSGLDEAWIDLAGGRLGQATADRIVELACQAPLQFRPASRYAYCNASFFVMAELLQRVTGHDHASYLQAHVLDPLGMDDTSYTPPVSPRVAAVVNAPWSDDDEAARARWIGARFPGGGLWSTATDLVRFGQCLLRQGAPLLAPATWRTMTALHTQGIPEATPSGDVPSYYGLGVSKIGPRNHNGPSAELRTPDGFGHGGATGTYLWVEPAYDLVFVFLSNHWGTTDDTFRRALNATIAARSAAIGGAG